MILNEQGVRDARAWEEAGIKLPGYDPALMREKTESAPVWLHFGAGNIFRGFIAGLQQRLLNLGLADRGIIAAETFDYDIIDKIYAPHDAMTLMVSLKPDGGTDMEVIASIARGLKADSASKKDWGELCRVFQSPSLQMVSYTITEKGYALKNMKGETLPVVLADIENGPEGARHAMSVTAALLLKRYLAGAYPIAMVSMDNCSRNGEKLRESVLSVAEGWVKAGRAPQGFYDWAADESRVSFPWSMIDKITPRPAEEIRARLEAMGVMDMAPVVTGKNTFIAPFVNAEVPQYLVVEDAFPAGRPPLEKAGVYMTNRDTVNMTERMKVTTCLNPLHTALAVFGCLFGYESIADEMKDGDLTALIRRVGYTEGLPVVPDPGILSPNAFIDEVLEKRFPNPFLPDTPRRIATDTSQKIPVRFGETLKSYMAREDLDASKLVAVPLVLAGWLRYLLKVDDKGNEMAVSADPMLDELEQALAGVRFGAPETAENVPDALLASSRVFGVSLAEAGLDKKVRMMLADMLRGPGAVRAALQKYLGR